MKAKIGNALLATLTPAPKEFDVWDTEIPGFLLRVHPTGKMTYYISYRRPDGRRSRIALGHAATVKPAQARDSARVILGKVAGGADPGLERQKASAKTLRAYLDHHYAPWAAAHRKTGAENVARIKSAFPDFLGKPLTEITAWRVEKWRAARKAAGKAATTINRDVATLRGALTKALSWELIQAHPLALVKPLKTDPHGIVRYLSDDEETRLRDALDARQDRIRTERASANSWRRDRGHPEMLDLARVAFVDHIKPIVLLAINTGCRRGELFQLTWDCVSFEREQITVRADIAKSGKARHIPLNTEASGILSVWWNLRGCPAAGIVFPAEDGGVLDNFDKAWSTVLSAADIENFRFHDTRHHFASRLVIAGVDLNTVRELLGHADFKTTLRYAHLAPKVKADAVKKLEREPSPIRQHPVLVVSGPATQDLL